MKPHTPVFPDIMVEAMGNQTCKSCENECEAGEELCRTCRILETGAEETLKVKPKPADFRQKSARARLFGDESDQARDSD